MKRIGLLSVSMMVGLAFSLAASEAFAAVEKETIEASLQSIVNQTKLLMDCKSGTWTQECSNTDTPIRYLGFQPDGQSCEGIDCHVKGWVVVEVTEGMKYSLGADSKVYGCLASNGRDPGFGNWISLRYDHSFGGCYVKDINLLKPGTARSLTVTLHFRKYDTGWKLEKYE